MYLAVQMESSSLMIITMGDERGERIDVVVTLSVPPASSHISAQPSNLATILHILQQFNDFEHLQRMHQFYNLHIYTKGHTSYLSFFVHQRILRPLKIVHQKVRKFATKTASRQNSVNQYFWLVYLVFWLVYLVF